MTTTERGSKEAREWQAHTKRCRATQDKIAYQVYGDEKYAGYLMENNRLLLEYLVFPGGVTLATPELADEVDEDLPIWRD